MSILHLLKKFKNKFEFKNNLNKFENRQMNLNLI